LKFQKLSLALYSYITYGISKQNNEEVFIVPKRHHKITPEGHTLSYEAGDMVSPVSALHDEFWQDFYEGRKPFILTKSKAEALPKWMRAQKALELFTAEG